MRGSHTHTHTQTNIHNPKQKPISMNTYIQIDFIKSNTID